MHDMEKLILLFETNGFIAHFKTILLVLILCKIVINFIVYYNTKVFGFYMDSKRFDKKIEKF